MRQLSRIKSFFFKPPYDKELTFIKNSIDDLKILNAKKFLRNINDVRNIHHAEFKVFSQFGEDGIIQYLINSIDVSSKIFIEFGVENYEEANTRF